MPTGRVSAPSSLIVRSGVWRCASTTVIVPSFSPETKAIFPSSRELGEPRALADLKVFTTLLDVESITAIW